MEEEMLEKSDVKKRGGGQETMFTKIKARRHFQKLNWLEFFCSQKWDFWKIFFWGEMFCIELLGNVVSIFLKCILKYQLYESHAINLGKLHMLNKCCAKGKKEA